MRAIQLVAVFLLECAVCFAQLPVISLEAKAVNSVLIDGGPVSFIEAAPGDELELEFRLRGWSVTPAAQLRGYLITMESAGFYSGEQGRIEPIGFNVHTDPANWCEAHVPFGNDPSPQGDGVAEAAFIDTTAEDFVFADQVPNMFPVVDVMPCDYRWANALFLVDGPISGPGGGSYYIATLMVRVSQDAEGKFTLGPNMQAGEVELTVTNQPPDYPIQGQNLTITVTGTPAPGPIVSSNPANGSIDARQPSSLPNCVDTPGTTQVVLTHAGSTMTVGLNSYVVTTEPPGEPTPEIAEVDVSGLSATITLDQRIPPGRWTRITHLATGTSVRIGHLPGDVNNDGHASPLDVLALIDHLNGVVSPPYATFQTDVDRSGSTNPADVLQVINLLNGADCFDPWNGISLPP